MKPNQDSARSSSMRVLAIDIGGTGIKAMTLDGSGQPLTERAKIQTPQPATPDAVLRVIAKLAKQNGAFDRISVGFPGVVRNGVVQSAPNLHPSWKGVNLAEMLSKKLTRPTKVANDADIQGFGAIKGSGIELVLTLGTGLGSALFVDGMLVPNLEAAHHPFRKGKTYEECLGVHGLKRAGRKKWNKTLRLAIRELERLFNYDQLFIGGGNAQKIEGDLPPNVQVVSNVAGLLGGIALWRKPS
ncbi:MAG: ROK family protein [Acidobacteria bacterium]|nr:ROK family protein [Acidobacteriota bacterium]